MKAPSTIIQHKNYKITTDIFSADLPSHPPKDALPAIAEAYKKTLEKDKSIITKLLHWQDKYPSVPQFRNILSLYYSLHGNKEKAYEVNEQLLQQFPNYLYAKINAAKSFIDNGQTDETLTLLGPGLDLSKLYPERKVFHYEEYINYYRNVINYYCKTGNENKAEEVLEDLKELADELDIEEDFEMEEDMILISRLDKINTLSPNEKTEANINERTEPTLPQTQKAPEFHFPQINLLYHHGFSTMPDSVISDLLKQDKEQLRSDLEEVVYDAIKRYKYFERKDLSNDENSFCLHALYLLKEINAVESLPAVLELLRQPQRLIEYWLFDLLTENIWQVIYALGINQPDKLALYLKEPLNYSFARTEVSKALSQIAHHHPERRAEIINLYKDVMQFFIQNSSDRAIVEETFLGLLIGDVIELKATELLPQIKALYEADTVDESVNGEWEEIEDLMKDDLGEKENLKDYFTIKEEIAGWEMASEEQAEEEFTDDWELKEDEEQDTTDYFYTGHDPFVRDTPKIGRNEPCFCGSGKKYKNCHGKNQ